MKEELGQTSPSDSTLDKDAKVESSEIKQNDKQDADGFTLVASRNFRYVQGTRDGKSRRGRRKGKRQIRPIDSWTVNDLEDRIRDRLEALSTNEFEKQVFALLEARCSTRPSVRHVVCYGLGSIHRSRNAQFQFALAVAMTRALELDPSHVYFYDPLFTELDKQLLASYHYTLIDHNEAITDETLFYMPHCGASLYSNVLKANWSCGQLERITFLSNAFAHYVDAMPADRLRVQAPFLTPTVRYLQPYCVALPPFDNGQVFNDVCVQYFDPVQLVQMDMEALAMDDRKRFWDIERWADKDTLLIEPLDPDTV